MVWQEGSGLVQAEVLMNEPLNHHIGTTNNLSGANLQPTLLHMGSIEGVTAAFSSGSPLIPNIDSSK